GNYPSKILLTPRPGKQNQGSAIARRVVIFYNPKELEPAPKKPMYLQGRRAIRQSPVALAFHMRYHVWNSLFYRARHPRSKARLVVKTPCIGSEDVLQSITWNTTPAQTGIETPQSVRKESRVKTRVPFPIAVLAVFAFFLMNPSPARAQPSGLVAAYAFNEGSG